MNVKVCRFNPETNKFISNTLLEHTYLFYNSFKPVTNIKPTTTTEVKQQLIITDFKFCKKKLNRLRVDGTDPEINCLKQVTRVQGTSHILLIRHKKRPKNSEVRIFSHV